MLTIAALILLLASSSTVSAAPPITTDVVSLAGLEGVDGLIVEKVEPEIEKAGLSRDDVRAEVELLLYKNRLLQRDSTSSRRLHVLHVQVGSMTTKNIHSFLVRLEFLQDMKCARPMPNSSLAFFVPEDVLTATWSRMSVGMTTGTDMSPIRRALRELTIDFVTDFLKVNRVGSR